MSNIQKGLLNRALIRYGFAVGMATVGFLVRQVLIAYGASGLPTYITFYPAIMFVAMVSGLWPGIIATVTVALVTDYWILPPQGFGVNNFTDAVGLAFFSGMGVFMSLVAEFYRRARKQAQQSSLELTRANEALRLLSSRLLSAHEEERKRGSLVRSTTPLDLVWGQLNSKWIMRRVMTKRQQTPQENV